MALECCGEHLYTEAEVRFHNDREHPDGRRLPHGREGVPMKNKIKVRPWWTRIFQTSPKYFWKCPVQWCHFDVSTNDAGDILAFVEAHEEWHKDLYAKGRP